jgi:hypothetical protein
MGPTRKRRRHDGISILDVGARARPILARAGTTIQHSHPADTAHLPLSRHPSSGTAIQTTKNSSPHPNLWLQLLRQHLQHQRNPHPPSPWTISHLLRHSPHAPLGHSHSDPKAGIVQRSLPGRRRPTSRVQKCLRYPRYLHLKRTPSHKVQNGPIVLSASAP